MSSYRLPLVLAGLLALAGATSAMAQDTEVVVTATAPGACEGANQDDLIRTAREAEKTGAHQRAAECYRAAGDHLRAHRAMIRVGENSAAAAKRNASVAASTAKAQLKRAREALR